MIIYKDMTICSCKECVNLDCKRNINNINWALIHDDMAVAMSDFSVCCLEFRKEDAKDENA